MCSQIPSARYTLIVHLGPNYTLSQIVVSFLAEIPPQFLLWVIFLFSHLKFLTKKASDFRFRITDQENEKLSRSLKIRMYCILMDSLYLFWWESNKAWGYFELLLEWNEDDRHRSHACYQTQMKHFWKDSTYFSFQEKTCALYWPVRLLTLQYSLRRFITAENKFDGPNSVFFL